MDAQCRSSLCSADCNGISNNVRIFVEGPLKLTVLFNYLITEKIPFCKADLWSILWLICHQAHNDIGYARSFTTPQRLYSSSSTFFAEISLYMSFYFYLSLSSVIAAPILSFINSLSRNVLVKCVQNSIYNSKLQHTDKVPASYLRGHRFKTQTEHRIFYFPFSLSR
jgi:hypothetical protein